MFGVNNIFCNEGKVLPLFLKPNYFFGRFIIARLWKDILVLMLQIHIFRLLLWKALVGGNRLWSIFENILSIFLLKLAKYGELNQIILHLLLHLLLIFEVAGNPFPQAKLSWKTFFQAISVNDDTMSNYYFFGDIFDLRLLAHFWIINLMLEDGLN